MSFRVSDEGGGIPRRELSKVWSYLYTTFDEQGEALRTLTTGDFDTLGPAAGLGVGLPISKLLARYFGGDLLLSSMEGHGTDATLWLRRSGRVSEEVFDSGIKLLRKKARKSRIPKIHDVSIFDRQHDANELE